MVHINNGTLQNHKKEHNSVISEMCMDRKLSETVKSERQRKCRILTHMYVESGKWYRGTFYLGRKRNTVVENGLCGHTSGRREWRTERAAPTQPHCVWSRCWWEAAAQRGASSLSCNDRAGWNGTRRGSSGQSGRRHTYSWFTLLHRRN